MGAKEKLTKNTKKGTPQDKSPELVFFALYGGMSLALALCGASKGQDTISK